MNWKRFKERVKAGRADESYYILGLDLGNDSSSLAFYNTVRGAPELLDVSGGYGRASMPTAMQYIPDCKEWIFGEYALLNNDSRASGAGPLVEKLGSGAYLDIDAKPMPVSGLLGMFIRELIGNVTNINPKAEIAGIVAAVSGYNAPEANEEIARAFAASGYGKELIALMPDRECVLTHYLARENPAAKTVLLLDYGSRELRAGVYAVNHIGGRVEIETENYMFSPELGVKNIDADLIGLFMEYLPPNLSQQDKWQLPGFLQQHKDLLLQKNNWSKPVKLYFNFTYPPVQATVTQDRVNGLVKPYREGFARLMGELFLRGRRADVYKADAVICAGGGFEMQWAKDAALSMFGDKNLRFYKNPKGLASEGAAFAAAKLLGAAEAPDVVIHDNLRLEEDVGVLARTDRRERFLPIISRGAFWWQDAGSLNFILNQPTAGAGSIELLSRGDSGELRGIGAINLDGLPDRPKGATKLAMTMRFEDKDNLNITISDRGFGEIYPAAGFSRTITVNPRR